MKDFRTIYKTLASTKNMEAHHVVQYAILKAMEHTNDDSEAIKIINQMLKRAFTPIRKKSRLDNGASPYGAMEKAIRYCTWTSLLCGEIETTDRYHKIVKALIDDIIRHQKALNNRHYVYIFVRQDISPEYQLVQASHASAKMGHRLGAGGIKESFFDELYFAVIGVPDTKGLATAIGDCHALGVPVHCFYEPDIGNVMTAVASEPIPANGRKRLLSYQKLVFSKSSEG